MNATKTVERKETENHVVVVRGAGQLSVESEAIPARVNADDVLVRVAFGGICGTDLHYWKHGAAGRSIIQEPLVLGHEISATVIEAAADGSPPEEGSRVAVHPATYPADGRWRKEGLESGNSYANADVNARFMGSAAVTPHTQGGFREYLVLPARMLRTLPADFNLRLAALIEPLSVAWHAVRRAGDVTGKSVFIVGAGPIGILVAAVCRAHGAKEVVVSDLYESALERAVAVAATHTRLANDVYGEATEFDVIFECSASIRGLNNCFNQARIGATVVLVGLFADTLQPTALSAIISKELTVRGAFRFSGEFDEVVDALVCGRLQAETLLSTVSHVFPLADTGRAFATASDPQVSGKVLLSFGTEH
jgi:L-idonate 5-dehydrogenase